MELREFRSGLDAWLDGNADELAHDPAPPSGASPLDVEMAQLSKVKRLAYDAGWMRYGWPERVGGLGGSVLCRAYLGEALAGRDLVEAGIYSMTEVLAPTMIDHAHPELAATMVPRLLRGDETWCQGFSEPDTGSNLAALGCWATPTERGWRVNGQKVWTSLAQYAQRCVLLVRTGSAEEAHRGTTALFVDMVDTDGRPVPGLTIRPIETMHGRLEFCEVFFDDVDVPEERALGESGGGWGVAMDLLPYERSTALWHRGAFLHRRLDQLLSTDGASLRARDVGEAYLQMFALRSRSRATQHRLASGDHLGPETSIDKILLATTEQAVFDLAATALTAEIVTGDAESDERWRSEFLYSRAATIYGGSAEIQRNIVARRLLDLGVDR